MKHKTEAQELVQIRLAQRGARKIRPIYEADELIKLALERHDSDKVAVSWSGGRCSTAVLRIALKICPDIRVFHTDHGVHFPETYQYVREMARAWGLNLTIAKPEKTFWQCVEEYGFPLPRKPHDPVKGTPAVREPACCRWLKKKPMAKFQREEGIEAFITGLRAAEARVRMLSTYQVGQFYFAKKEKVWKYHPIVFLTTREVIDYYASDNCPMNPIYKRTDRTGCWPCTAYVGWKENLMRTNLKFYNFLMKKMGEKGEQRMLDHFYRAHVEPPCHTERGVA